MVDRDEMVRYLRTEIAALNPHLDSNNQLLLSLCKQLQGHETCTGDERRTQIFRRAAIDIVPDDSVREFSNYAPVLIKDLGDALITLGSRLDHKYAEIKAIGEITERMNAGVFFDEVLDHVFEHFEKLIPYDRLSVALVEKGDKGEDLVRWPWARAKYNHMHINKGYMVIFNDCNLKEIADTRKPRIIDNLENYLRDHPNSSSTLSVMKEGIQSSLTCPLIARGTVIGFIFFSSLQPNTYHDQHVDLFLQIAGELALTLEKSRAYEELYLRNEFIRKMFGLYVTDEVVEAALNSKGPLKLGGGRCHVTVLMADLRGFTPMSENLPPEKVVDCLNVFLGTMADVVMKYGGSIDNFIGDALMAVFGVPMTKPDDAARAVACAVEMQNQMTSVNAEIEGKGGPELSMGIGLSTGEVVAGNIGSEMRLKYSVIGSNVNLAARIEGIASGGQIFASDGTFNEVRDIIQTAGNLNVKLKGLNHPVPVYEITGIGDKYNVKVMAKDAASA